MAHLIYTAMTSLDGYVADADGNFDWAAPNEEVHAFVNDRQRSLGTHLCGRRLYEVLSYWDREDPDWHPIEQDYARVWQASEKVVYSRTLETVTAARTRLERAFDPEAVREMKRTASADIAIGGPDLAAQALRAGLVDEVAVLMAPVIVGGGNHALPADLRLDLELRDSRVLAGGWVFASYAVRESSG